MPRYDLYAIEVDRRRNCYSYKEFEHIVRHYKNQKFVVQERRMEYEDNYNMDNLKEEENLVALDQVLTTTSLQYSVVE